MIARMQPHAERSTNPLRILTAAATWQGANDYAFVRAFRRLGHSVNNVPSAESEPLWETRPMRAVKRLLTRHIAAEYNARLLREAREHKPDIFFVFKGPLVKRDTIKSIRSMGAVAIQFYPDVSFYTHGPWLPDALREYDWVFTTKSFGLHDMEKKLGIRNSSFLPHGFDPETHCPHPTGQHDLEQYGCDISFIGNWSPKKEMLLSHISEKLPKADFRIWGPPKWARCSGAYQRQHVIGQEYAKALNLSRVNVGLLSEQRTGSSSGDQITARTFEVPGAGGFLLHERTDEFLSYFKEGTEAACFSSGKEMIEKIRYYLEHDEERRAIAKAGHDRSIHSGYSIDFRALAVIEKYREMRSVGEQKRPELRSPLP